MRKFKPQYPSFTDLGALKDWHQSRAEICRAQAQRMGNTAAATEELHYRGRQDNLNRKAQMHESAVRMLQTAESLLAAAMTADSL